MREWREIHGQLHALVMESGMRPNEVPASYEEIHRALLSGLLGNIGFKANEDGEYLGARGIKFSIFPGSALKKAKPKWIVAADLTETAKLYARCAARIDPLWVEQAGGRLCKRHYFDPHWEKKTAQVSAFERVTLYGLTIVPKRRVYYGAINPKEAREIFIRSALVAGDYATHAPFFEHNRKLIAEVAALEHKTRRPDVLVNEQEIFAFYDGIIPEGISNGAAFEKWRRQAEQKDPRCLYLTREYLMRHEAADVTEARFPDNIVMDGFGLPLTYRFEPGHPLDGVTVTVPLPLLNKLELARFDWLVPGLIREKITWYLKALPKQVRRQVVPVPEFVTRFLGYQDDQERERENAAPRKGQASQARTPLAAALAAFVQRSTGAAVSPGAWENETPPSHLLMNYRIVDEAGEELAMSRNLGELKAQLGQAAQLTFSQAESGERLPIERDEVKCWDFGDLPEEIPFARGGRKLVGYPALALRQDKVSIHLFDTREAARASMRAGVRQLLRYDLREQVKQLEKNLWGQSRAVSQAVLQLHGLIDPNALREDMLNAIWDRAFIGDDALPRREQEFAAQRQRARVRLPAVTEAMLRTVQNIANESQSLMSRMSVGGPGIGKLKKELEQQLHHLVHAGFLSGTPWEQLQHLPRYIRGMSLRLDKYGANPERDVRHSAVIAGFWAQYAQRLQQHQKAGINDPALARFRWQVEELRISLFAQELKTPHPVSAKRLQKLWEEIEG
jgi:ATP-dependent helicase HrpA